MSKEQVKIRVGIYKLFEELSGKKMTAETHEKLKEAIMAYSEEEHKIVIESNKMVQNSANKLKQMAKVLYNKGKSAEMWEKDLLFLKKFFEENE